MMLMPDGVTFKRVEFSRAQVGIVQSIGMMSTLSRESLNTETIASIAIEQFYMLYICKSVYFLR